MPTQSHSSQLPPRQAVVLRSRKSLQSRSGARFCGAASRAAGSARQPLPAFEVFGTFDGTRRAASQASTSTRKHHDLADRDPPRAPGNRALPHAGPRVRPDPAAPRPHPAQCRRRRADRRRRRRTAADRGARRRSSGCSSSSSSSPSATRPDRSSSGGWGGAPCPRWGSPSCSAGRCSPAPWRCRRCSGSTPARGAGLLAGGMNASAAIGTAGDAIARLSAEPGGAPGPLHQPHGGLRGHLPGRAADGNLHAHHRGARG